MNLTSVKGGIIGFPLFLLKGNAILTMTPKAGCDVIFIHSKQVDRTCPTPFILASTRGYLSEYFRGVQITAKMSALGLILFLPHQR